MLSCQRHPGPHCRAPNKISRSAVRFPTIVLALVLALAANVWAAPSDSAPKPDAPIDFQNEVIAAISKAGCNAGRCHGNSNGRGGFRLSLRGQRPAVDYWAIAHDAESRRVDRAFPDRSLLLLKGTAQVPHEGGLRFREDSPEYAAIRQWIAGGLRFENSPRRQLQRIEVSPTDAIVAANDDELQLRVTAFFFDGSSGERAAGEKAAGEVTSRDVTQLAIYEPADFGVTVTRDGSIERQRFGPSTVVVRYLQQQVAVSVAFLRDTDDFHFSAPEPVDDIDVAVFDRLRRLRIRPSRLTTDVEFLRRVSVDLTGQLPTADEARRFATDTSTEKRARLIDRLLGAPQFADHWARKWADLLRTEEKTMDAQGVEVFYHWIRDAIERDVPQDQFVREILMAVGSTYEQPSANFYRALREPELRAEAVAQVFMGTRLQCAKCHDHPFEKWKQDDYHDFAALFAPIQYKIIKNERRDELDKNQFIGEQIVWLDTEQHLTNPDSGKRAWARFLGKSDRSDEPSIDRLQEFANWLTEPDHPLFARVLANRIWADMNGRGIVDPVDDFRITNPPSNPELLDILTEALTEADFRIRPVLRRIANSCVYQLSSEWNESNRDDERNFSHAMLSRLPAEVLLDAIDQVTEVPSEFDGYPRGTRAGQLAGVNKTYQRSVPDGGMRFLQMFGKPARIMACACERSNETTLGQVFELTSGGMIHEKLSSDESCLTRLVQDDRSDADIVDELFWRTLSRAATDVEVTAMQGYADDVTGRREAFEDLLWGLINSKEFLMRR